MRREHHRPLLWSACALEGWQFHDWRPPGSDVEENWRERGQRGREWTFLGPSYLSAISRQMPGQMGIFKDCRWTELERQEEGCGRNSRETSDASNTRSRVKWFVLALLTLTSLSHVPFCVALNNVLSKDLSSCINCSRNFY